MLQHNYVNSILVNLLVLCATVIHCDKKPVYHEPSKQVFEAGTALPGDALFGYSITYQKMRKKIVIGAPKADGQGEVFECDTSHNTCSQVNIDFDPQPIEHTHFWLGATVCAASNFFITCAPRYSNKYGKNGWHRTFSRCFYQSAVTGTINNKSPIELEDEEKVNSNLYFFNDRLSKVWEKRFDTMGWSMDVTSDDVTIVGGPGAATGRAMVIPKRKSNRPQLIHLRRNNSDPDALVLYEFGYSVKAGKFLGNEVYAISSPYGVKGQGKVLFFSKELEYIQAIVDDNVGVIFGGALCSARLGAGDEALLVGAPALGSRDEFDAGAVYVYLNEAGRMRRKHTIRGYKNNGYFGYAIANVGDLNLDGKDEIVISAPYENEYRGAVYIFSGADLVKEDAAAHAPWLQRVEGSAPAQFLGLALAAVQDLDGNGCNELSVGLPGNNSALLMKCMTFITFTLGLEENTTCYEESNNSTSVFMDMCIKFTYNANLKNIENYVSTVIKLKHPNATLASSENNTLLHNVSLAAVDAMIACRSLQILLPLNGNYDKEIVLQVNASLFGQDPSALTDFKYGLVMLTDETQTHLEKKLTVPGSNLGMNLSTSFSTTVDYTIGSTKNENLTIVVWNTANSRGGAYAACVRAHIRGAGVARSSTHCAPVGDAVTCVPSEPIFAGKSMISTVTLDTGFLTSEADFIDIEAKLFKRCDGLPYSVKTLRIPLQKDVNITVVGESIPSAVVNVSEAEIAFGYENIRHVYSIINTGMTSWGGFNCTVHLPQYVNYNVSTDSRGGECIQGLNKETVTCIFSRLPSNTKIGIITSMDVLPGTHFIEKVRTGKAELETEITCMIASKERVIRTTTTLKLLRTTVPTWILVVAVAIGLIVVLIMTFVLYECGFLRRKHKEELVALKKDVRRQSIRRSMRLRESMTEQLLESKNQADDTQSIVTVEVADTLYDQPESGSRRVVADIHSVS